MTPKLFTQLTIGAALSLALSALVYAAYNSWSPGKVEGEKVAPLVAANINDLTTVTVREGKEVITLVRGKDGWSMKERDNYPVEAAPVRKVVVALADAELVERKTRNKDRYSLLGLEDVSAKDAKSRGLRLADKSGKVLADIVIGNTRHDAFGSGKGGNYVRREGEQQTWLMNKTIDLKSDVSHWLNGNFFNIDRAKISKVTIKKAGKDAVTLVRGEGKVAGFKLENIPDGKKLKTSANLDGTANAYASMDLQDVRKLTQTPGGDKVSTATIETSDGMKVTFRMRSEDGSNWVSLVAEEEKKPEDEKSQKALSQAVKTINDRAQSWEYKLPGWKTDLMFKSFADLVEDEKKPDKAGG